MIKPLHVVDREDSDCDVESDGDIVDDVGNVGKAGDEYFQGQQSHVDNSLRSCSI